MSLINKNYDNIIPDIKLDITPDIKPYITSDIKPDIKPDSILDVNFLSFDNAELSEAKIINEYMPILNNYILEIYNIKKEIQSQLNIPNQSLNPDLMRKLKLIVDVVSIYNEPKILSMIKDYKDEKENEKLREEEMEKIRQELLKKRDYEHQNTRYNTSYNTNFSDSLFGHRLPSVGHRLPSVGSFWNNDKFSEEEAILSDISEDDLDSDKVVHMLNEEYANIATNSILKKIYNTERHNYCQIETTPDDENLDDIQNVNEQNNAETNTIENEGDNANENANDNAESTPK